MHSNTRRNFLKMAAGSLSASAMSALIPSLIREAVAAPAANTTGTINDVQHIVIFTQENRAFDHYYGSLQGVRGFNDRFAISLPNGAPVWQQPTSSTGSYILPFHIDTTTTSAICINAAAMDYPTDIGIWNKGLYNAWNTARTPGLGMSYFTRNDLPFYYALADAFTICDQYHCSTLTQTNPNRLHVFSGSNGLSVGQTAVLDNSEPVSTWPTVAETLQAANISWRVYQETDNFDDNALAWFANFKNAPTSSPLYKNGLATVPDIVQAFAADVAAGTLPQVSWIVAPAAQSEHADYHPCDGEDLTARLLAALVANPTVWGSTIFLLNYDENGGFFDHDPPPMPPASSTQGQTTMTTQGEITAGQPIGLGFRVPMLVISPWSKGGYVCSELFDHTSTIRLIEERFGIHCPNISPWRRSVCGDLTSAFNFKTPDATAPSLPSTSTYVSTGNSECSNLPAPTVPTTQSMPAQESGTRRSRALPYELHASGRVVPSATSFWLIVANSGTAGAAFQAFDLDTPSNPPRRYAVDAGAQITDSWSGATLTGTRYSLALKGPNGFYRQFSGDIASTSGSNAANPEIRVCYDVANSAVYLTMMNTGSASCTFVVAANAYVSGGPWTFQVAGGAVAETNWSVTSSANWYDFTVTVQQQSSFLRRFAGRLENGSDLTSDPAAA
ncbi:phosphocholine-specific phospholipase C [Paraburkholderia agricolaris]|uniref:phosphocholine-specific phospholipase C n=1 Tax=Paraburkholderia agricolaris TaxID=2152888 RepID=UPI0012919E26|nr:phospholipase C, phosphocholine-specific [Paraburkholderia agricolaris]